MDEIWRDIPRNEGYQASSLGKIREKESQKVLKRTLHYDNYLQVTIKVDGKSKSVWVHKLVALAFHGEPEGIEDPVVDHLDECTWNDRADNLEWISRKENGIRWRERNPDKVGKRQKVICLETGQEWDSFKECADELGMRYETVRGICKSGIPVKGYSLRSIYVKKENA